MTEYESASLALQLAAIWIAAIVGAAQCSLIGYGLYIMRQASKQRDAQHREKWRCTGRPWRRCRLSERRKANSTGKP
ncbi:MAG: hypothetical protein OXE44_03295 [Nitrospinae bacterium]|nr:hypothetical protein [Nitrospinota bacterium]